MFKFIKIQDSLNLKEFFLGLKGIFLNNNIVENNICKTLKKHFHFQDILLFNSGREALFYILNKKCPLGSEIIIPAYGCPILLETIKASGRKPVLVDIEEKSIHISYSQVLDNITSHTAAIIIVHEFGMAYPSKLIEGIKKHFSGIVIEDAAIAMSSLYDNKKKIGLYGDFTIFSGSIGKPHSCVSWGALGSKDVNCSRPDYNKRKRNFISIGYALIYLLISQPFIYNLLKAILNKVVKKDSSNPPENYNLPSQFDNFVMEYKISNIKNYDQTKRKIANLLIELFKKHQIVILLNSDGQHTFSRIPVLITENKGKTFIEACKANGIEIVQPYQYNFPGNFKNSDYLRKNLYAITIKNNEKILTSLESALSYKPLESA